MKKLSGFRKSFFVAFMVAGSGLLSSNCSNDDLTVDRTVPDDVVATRSSAFHWTCPDSKCGFDLNAGWQSHCGRPGCKEEYSDSHGILILTFADYIKNTVGFDTGGGGGAGFDYNRIELPNGKFPKFAPEPWYETPCAMKYYNELRNSSQYRLTPGYAEAVEYAWYRTVRILYPKYHNSTTVEREYTRLLLNEGRNLTGFKGSGILDASEAAVKAFATCR